MPWQTPTHWQIPAGFERNRAIKRQEYLRVKVVENSDGTLVLDSYQNQDSGVLSSTVASDALAIVPPNTKVKPGDKLDVLLLDELLNS